jgi:hypothetical protein
VTGITRSCPHQVYARVPRCAFCGEPIRIGSFKPRRFCSDRCRKAAARIRTRGSPYRGTNSNAPAVKFARFRTRNPNEIKGQNSEKNGPSTAFNLISGGRTGSLDPRIVAKIFATEIGVPTGTVISSDGITATVTPTHWVRR